MSPKDSRREGAGALELIEEAVHLLRVSPLALPGSYYLGSLPFVLGFLYFWADMSRGSSAHKHCASSAFAVALLFLWMKTGQALFAQRLKAQISGRPAAPLTVSRFARAALIQTILQPSGLFLLPLSLVIVLPFGWTYAFYQSVTAFAAEEGAKAKSVFQKALKQAQLWPRQNHLLLGVLLLFGLAVFLDLAVGLTTVPSLIKRLFGIETAFTRSRWSFLNTTFLATLCGLTYLCLDPLIKAVYLLRCFYGESLHTGEDLRAELKQYMPAARAGVALLAIIVGNGLASQPGAAGSEQRSNIELRTSSIQVPTRPCLGPCSMLSVGCWMMDVLPWKNLRENERLLSTGPTPNSGIAPADLDRSIDRVLSRREYNWRLPREKGAEDETGKGFFAAFIDGIVETIRSWVKAIGSAIKTGLNRLADLIDWLREKVLGKRATTRDGGGASLDWMVFLRALILILLVLAAVAVVVLFVRAWKRRGAPREVSSEALELVPDLSDENLTASRLPEGDWLNLARELMGQGDLRLALRAFYLASLAHLAQRDLIRVAKFKSNRDYEQELRRRARGLPDLQAAFGENVGIFDRAWYGLHDVTGETLRHFQLNLEKIRSC